MGTDNVAQAEIEAAQALEAAKKLVAEAEVEDQSSKTDPPTGEKGEPTYAIPGMDGVVRNLTEAELLMVAQKGLQVFQEENEKLKTEEANKEPLTSDQELVALREELNQVKLDREADKKNTAIKTALIEEGAKHELTKVGPRIKELLELNTLITANQNRSLSIGDAYSQTVETMQEALKEMNEHNKSNESDNNRVISAMTSGRSGGGLSTVDASKKYTSKDVKSGASRNALQEVLNERFNKE